MSSFGRKRKAEKECETRREKEAPERVQRISMRTHLEVLSSFDLLRVRVPERDRCSESDAVRERVK